MPWPLPLVWRYLATTAVLGAPLWVLDPVPSASPAVPGGLAVAGTTVLGLAWRAATRPPRPASRPDGGAGEESPPYSRDLHAQLLVDRRGYLFAQRVLFSTATVRWRTLRDLPDGFEERFARPVPVVTTGGHTWWMAGNEFYRVTAEYGPDTARAVVEALRWRRRSRLDPEWGGTAADRREEVVRALRPSLGRHAGVVCVRCRSPIDVRREPVAELWTQGGLRRTDVTVLCRACEGDGAPSPQRRRRWRRAPDVGGSGPGEGRGHPPSYRRPHAEDRALGA